MSRWAMLLVLAGACSHSRGSATADLAVDTSEDAAVGLDTVADLGETSLWAHPTFRMLGAHDGAGHSLLYVGGFVYSPSYTHASVTAYDAATYAVAATIVTGPGPYDLSTDGTSVYVVDRMAAVAGDVYVSIIDSATNHVTKSLVTSTHAEGSDPDNYPMTAEPFSGAVANGELYVDFPFNDTAGFLPVDVPSGHEHTFLPSGSNPSDLDIANGQLFIVDENLATTPSDDVLAVRSLTGALVKQFAIPGVYHDVHAASGKVFAARAPQDMSNGQVVVVDATTLDQTTIDVGKGPYGLATNGDRLYVMCQYDRRVDIIDIPTLTVVDHIDLSTFTPAVTNPRGIAVSPAEDVYIESDGMISVVSPSR